MSAIFIGIRFCIPNFIKIGQFYIEIWRFNDFKMAAVYHLVFSKFAHDLFRRSIAIPSAV